MRIVEILSESKVPSVRDQIINDIKKHGGDINDYFVRFTDTDKLGFSAKQGFGKTPDVDHPKFSVDYIGQGVGRRALWFYPASFYLNNKFGAYATDQPYAWLVKLKPNAWLQTVKSGDKEVVQAPDGKQRVGILRLSKPPAAIFFMPSFDLVGRYYDYAGQHKRHGEVKGKPAPSFFDKIRGLDEELGNVSRRNFLKGMGAMAVSSPLAAKSQEPNEEDIYWGTRKDYDEKPRKLYPNVAVEKPNQYIPQINVVIYNGLIFNPMIYKDFVKLKSLKTPDIETLQPNSIQGISEKLFLTQIDDYNYFATDSLIKRFKQEYDTEVLVKRNYDIKQRMARGDWSFGKDIQKQPPNIKVAPNQIQKPLYPWEKDTKRDI